MSKNKRAAEIIPALELERSTHKIGAGAARRWVSEELQCTLEEAEAALLKRISAGFRAHVLKLRGRAGGANTQLASIHLGSTIFPSGSHEADSWLDWFAENAAGAPSPEVTKTDNWLTGDFNIRYFEQVSDQCDAFTEVEITGLSFFHADLLDAFDLKMSFASAESPAKATRAGRRISSWWPAFAEELALYIYEEGLPEGLGTEGQSTVIAAIFSRMAALGHPEPSRTQIQPVINAVLSRIRSGK